MHKCKFYIFVQDRFMACRMNALYRGGTMNEKRNRIVQQVGTLD